MFKKIIDWLDWNVRIRFIDNVWWPLIGREREPKMEMDGVVLKAHRVTFGLTPQQMADMFQVSLKEYKRWERNGLLSPHDTQGPVICLIRIMQMAIKEINDNKRILEQLGYRGKI